VLRGIGGRFDGRDTFARKAGQAIPAPTGSQLSDRAPLDRHKTKGVLYKEPRGPVQMGGLSGTPRTVLSSKLSAGNNRVRCEPAGS
jgi:hypothetical protein